MVDIFAALQVNALGFGFTLGVNGKFTGDTPFGSFGCDANQVRTVHESSHREHSRRTPLVLTNTCSVDWWDQALQQRYCEHSYIDKAMDYLFDRKTRFVQLLLVLIPALGVTHYFGGPTVAGLIFWFQWYRWSALDLHPGAVAVLVYVLHYSFGPGQSNVVLAYVVLTLATIAGFNSAFFWIRIGKKVRGGVSYRALSSCGLDQFLMRLVFLADWHGFSVVRYCVLVFAAVCFVFWCCETYPADGLAASIAVILAVLLGHLWFVPDFVSDLILSLVAIVGPLGMQFTETENIDRKRILPDSYESMFQYVLGKLI